MSTNKLAFKAGSLYLVSNFLISGIAVLSTIIFTRILTTESFGIIQTYYSWMGILTIIGTLDIYSCVQIARHDFSHDETEAFISSILTISSISIFILYLFLKLFSKNINAVIAIPEPLIDVMFLEIFFTNAFTISQTDNLATFSYKKFTVISLLIAVISPILAIVLIQFQENNFFYGRIIGFAIPKLLISIVIYFQIMIKGHIFLNRKYWIYALKISVPLIPHHLGGIILTHFDKIMINKYTGASDVGIYSLAYSYSLLLSMIWSSYNQAWSPWFFKKMKKDTEEIKIYAKPYLVSFSVVFIVMIFLGPEALMIFSPKEYWSGIWVIPPVLLGIFFQFVYSLYVNIEFFYKKTNYIPIGTIAAAIINIVLNAIFIPIFGYVAAAYTTCISYFLLFIFHFRLSKRLEEDGIFDDYHIFRILLAMVVISLVSIFEYNMVVERYLTLLTILLFIYAKYYKSVLGFIRKLNNKNENA